MQQSVSASNDICLKEVGDFADLPMEIEVELDRRSMKIRDLLELGPGAQILLTKAAGERIDVSVNGVRFGFGEVVVLEGKISLRLTDFENE